MELGQWKSGGLVDYQTLLIENEKLKQGIDQYKRERDELIKDVEKLRELKDQLIFENRYLEEQVKSLRNKYTNLTEHIRLKALHNPSVSRYKDLMHFIDELEGGFYEGN